MRKFIIISWLLIAVMNAQSEVSRLRIEALSGAESVQALALIGKLVIDAEELCLYDTEGFNLGCTPFNQIGKIVFLEDEPSEFDEVVTPTIHVFPNPAKNTLFIQGIEGTLNVRVYTLQGKPVQSAMVTDGGADIFVGNLPKGTYLLQVGAQVVKFIKN